MAATIFMSTGESSGDLHGAKLAAALIRQRPDCRVVGMGGCAMREAGVEIIIDNAEMGVVGLWEVVAHGAAIWRAYRRMKAWLIRHRPEVVVLIDYPEFHFQIARLAKRLGLRVVYYIAPQIWAWRSGRLRTLARLADQMIVILPFERVLYQSVGVPCEFVGHPLLDDITTAPERSTIRARWGLSPVQPVVGLFPGSRRAEVQRHLPLMLAAAERLHRDRPEITFVLGRAPSIPGEDIERALGGTVVPVTVRRGESSAVLAAADAVMVASGTITLQAALLRTPMVIIYKVAPLTWLVARWLVRVPFAGLPNLIAGEAVVPELLQHQATPDAIAGLLAQWLADPGQLELIRKRLAGVRDRVGEPGGSVRAATVILRCVDQWAAPASEAA